MATTQRKATNPKLRPIREEIEALLLKHGYADWAFCIRAPGKKRFNIWAAGDGKDPLLDRERMGNLHFEMELLQADIVAHQNLPILAQSAPRQPEADIQNKGKEWTQN